MFHLKKLAKDMPHCPRLNSFVIQGGYADMGIEVEIVSVF